MAATAAGSLPPVRTSCHVPLSLMTSLSEETLALWLKLGALEKLEQAVLDGYGDQLCGKTSRIPQVNRFLKQVPLFQTKIREIHGAVSQGRLRDVQHLIDRKKLAFCRDHNGASPLHKAVIFGHQDVIEYLVKRYPGVIHIRDHQGRTALHYAAFLPDRGEIYQYLLALGADERAMDVYGRQPSYYLDGQNESTLRQLRDGSMLNGLRKIKPRYYGQVASSQPFPTANKMTVSKSQIRELISDSNLDSLEDLVLQGQGDRLLGETSPIPKVQSFLNIVPMYMERIYDVHRAVMRDQLEHVVILLENRKLSLARDQLGATPLHKAVWFGHYKIAHFISQHYPETLNAIDLEGRTALHYAAALKDSKNMYGILIEGGANKGIYDNKGKLADYYSQYPEHLNLEEVIKRCHKVNANYLANTASRIKGKSPVRQSPPPSNGNLSSPRSEENGSVKENCTGNDSGNENELISMLQKDKLTKRLDVNSANIRRWVRSKDVEKLSKAVMEGYGDKVVRAHSGEEDEIAAKISEMVERVNAIHSAVSSDDLVELQSHLDEKDFALAKDHMGMTPLHKAVLLRKPKIVAFLIEKFPEAINAKNKNGLTALHYAAAMSRKDSQQSYKLLTQAGADTKIRDNHGRTPDYYKTHLITMPNKGLSRPAGGRSGTDTLNRYSKQGVLERMTTALQRGDVELLQELVLEGHGKHLIGKTSWHEDVKNFLKELPNYMTEISSLQSAVRDGDLEVVRQLSGNEPRLLRARDETGAMPIHVAATAQHADILSYFTQDFPFLLNAKDAMGRTALHIVSQKGNRELQKLLKQAGADPKILDQKGKTPDFYLQGSKPESMSIKQSTKFSPNSQFNSSPKKPANILRRKSSTNNLQAIRKHSTAAQILTKNNVEADGEEKDEAGNEKDESHNEEVATDIETSFAPEDEANDTSDVKDTDENDEGNLTSVAEEESALENGNEEENATEEPTDAGTQEETQEENTDAEEAPTIEENNPESIDVDEKEAGAKPDEEVDNKEEEEEVGPKGEEQTEEEASEDVTEEGTEDDLKDTAEESPSQSEESNATVVEANAPREGEENTQNEKTEDEEEDDSSEKIDEDSTQEKIPVGGFQDAEGKTVAEVGGRKGISFDSVEEGQEEGDKKEDEEDNVEGKEKEIKDKEEGDKGDVENVDGEDAANEGEDEKAEEDTNNEGEETEALETENKEEETKVEDSTENQEPVEPKENEEKNEEDLAKPEENNETEAQNEDLVEEKDSDETAEPNGNVEETGPEEEETGIEKVEEEVTENKDPQEEIENNTEMNGETEADGSIEQVEKIGDSSTEAPHQTKDHLDELIEHWIKEGDLLRLEHVVLAGQGDRLIERTSDDKQVQDFLDLVPIYMAKIRAVHEAVAKGHLREVRSVLTRKRFALSRDHVGASPLHLGVLHGHTDVSTYIISHFPETMDGPDNEGRTPLHYAAALHDNGALYRLLKTAGADENIEDKSGHSPKFYLTNPGSLTLTSLLEPYSTSE